MAVGIKHLSKENASTFGIIGTGAQGLYQTIFACTARKIKQISLYDVNVTDQSSFIDKLKKHLKDDSIVFKPCKSVAEVVANSELIITATPSSDPIIPNDAALLKGKCFVAIGSYKQNMREFSDAIFSLVNKVYVDLPFACEESGDLSIPLESGVLKKKM